MDQMSTLLSHVIEISQRAEADTGEGGESRPLELGWAREDHSEDVSVSAGDQRDVCVVR